MKDKLWRQLEPLADQADEEIEHFLTSPQANNLKAIIQKAWRSCQRATPYRWTSS